jgi:hypothetical protein
LRKQAEKQAEKVQAEKVSGAEKGAEKVSGGKGVRNLFVDIWAWNGLNVVVWFLCTPGKL